MLTRGLRGGPPLRSVALAATMINGIGSIIVVEGLIYVTAHSSARGIKVDRIYQGTIDVDSTKTWLRVPVL